MGTGRHSILGIRSSDPVLSLAGAIGLGATLGVALVVDLTREIPVKSPRTLGEIASEGPLQAELSPGRRGVAVITGGGISDEDAIEVITGLGSHWPAVVVRVSRPDWPFPTVPVTPLLPGLLAPRAPRPPSVWQPVGRAERPPGPGPVLPRLPSSTLRRILTGSLPRRSRWVEAWRPVWELPWA